MRTVPLLLLSLAACGGSSTSSTLGNAAGHGTPPGAPPTIAWSGAAPVDGGDFTITGMPAVADDGSRVLIAWQLGDGGRGYPNLRLHVVDRADKVVDERMVLDANEVDDLGDSATLDVAPHNLYLAESNASMRWRPLTPAEVQAEGEGEDPDAMFASKWSSKLGDVALRFDDTARVVIEQGGKVVVDRVMADWLVKDRPMYEGAADDEICSNPIYLGSVHVDAGRHLAVIGVEYRGTDSCWEPTGELHVVAW